jgi:hypothetical protein
MDEAKGREDEMMVLAILSQSAHHVTFSRGI